MLLLPLVLLSGLPTGAFAFAVIECSDRLQADRTAYKPAFVHNAPPVEARGLYYLRARYLNAANGRFWSADEYEGDNDDPASLHKYMYANGDGVNMLDPSGNMSGVAEQISVAGIIATAAVFTLPQTRRFIQEGGQAAVSLTGELGESVTGLIQQAAAQAAGLLAVAYESVRDQIKRATDELKKIGQKLNRIPKKFVPISQSILPSVAAHVTLAQGGIPQILTRTTSIAARRNRAAAIGGLPPAGLLMSWDEYPFASTVQGGLGASVMAVPLRENWIQGGIIGGSYGIQKIAVGDNFWVIVIP